MKRVGSVASADPAGEATAATLIDRCRFPIFDRFVCKRTKTLVAFGGVTRLRLRELLLALRESLLRLRETLLLPGVARHRHCGLTHPDRSLLAAEHRLLLADLRLRLRRGPRAIERRLIAHDVRLAGAANPHQLRTVLLLQCAERTGAHSFAAHHRDATVAKDERVA